MATHGGMVMVATVTLALPKEPSTTHDFLRIKFAKYMFLDILKLHHVPPFIVMIDASHRLAYPLAKRLEGRVDGDSVRKGDNKNGG
jgi:hypothetical protein